MASAVHQSAIVAEPRGAHGRDLLRASAWAQLPRRAFRRTRRLDSSNG